MTGAVEILVLILLIISILILPRLLGSGKGQSIRKSHALPRLTPAKRAGIILTLLYPVGAGLHFKPWDSGQLIPYISFGVFPVCLIWSVIWIIAGRKK